MSIVISEAELRRLSREISRVSTGKFSTTGRLELLCSILEEMLLAFIMVDEGREMFRPRTSVGSSTVHAGRRAAGAGVSSQLNLLTKFGYHF
jgi:hypothetical protein